MGNLRCAEWPDPQSVTHTAVMRKRILRVALIAATIATLVFGVPLLIVAQQLGILDERGEIERFAASTALRVTVDQLSDKPLVLASFERGSDIALYGPDGNKMFGVGPATADSTAIRARRRGSLVSVEANGGFVVAVPVADETGVTSVLRISSPNPLISSRFISLIAVMIGLALFSLAVAAFVAARQARKLARPLEDVATAADQLGHGDFTVRHRPSGVAEIDQVGTALDSTAARLDTILSRERAFSADASHQLRTPLTRLRLGLERAVDTDPVASQAAIQAAIGQADTLTGVIDDLLALARDLPRSADVQTDIAVLVEKAGVTYRTVLAEHGRRLTITQGRVPPTSASRAAVEHILQVLLDNAVVHGAGAVGLSTRTAGAVTIIAVTDEGAIPASAEEDLFVRRDGHSTSGGSHGIGLALARSLAEAEMGRLVYSGHTHEHGTVFTLFLPVAGPSAHEFPSGPGADPTTGDEGISD